MTWFKQNWFTVVTLIFVVGASYQRLSAIETRLDKVEAKNIELMQSQIDATRDRVTRLELMAEKIGDGVNAMRVDLAEVKTKVTQLQPRQ